MKKYVLSLAMMLTGATLLTGCLDSDDSNGGSSTVVPVTKGMFVVNSGDSFSNIDGTLTYHDFTNSKTTQEAYKKANGESLGDNPTDAIVHGEKMYVVGSGRNTIFVLNAKTFQEITQIETIDLLGEEKGQSPHSITAYGDKIYFTTYGGCVAEVDTASFKLTKTFPVGSYPEGISVGAESDGNMTRLKLYVANSDRGNGNGSISVIDLSSGSVTNFTNENLTHPMKIAAAGSVYYVLDGGKFDKDWNKEGAALYMVNSGTVTKIVDATDMAPAGYYILTYNAPQGTDNVTYNIFNIQTAISTPFTLTGDTARPIKSPSAIAIDPNTGFVMIASLGVDETTGRPNQTPGFVNIYSSQGAYSTTVETGVNPCKIGFNYGTVKVNY